MHAYRMPFEAFELIAIFTAINREALAQTYSQKDLCLPVANARAGSPPSVGTKEQYFRGAQKEPDNRAMSKASCSSKYAHRRMSESLISLSKRRSVYEVWSSMMTAGKHGKDRYAIEQPDDSVEHEWRCEAYVVCSKQRLCHIRSVNELLRKEDVYPRLPRTQAPSDRSHSSETILRKNMTGFLSKINDI